MEKVEEALSWFETFNSEHAGFKPKPDPSAWTPADHFKKGIDP